MNNRIFKYYINIIITLLLFVNTFGFYNIRAEEQFDDNNISESNEFYDDSYDLDQEETTIDDVEENSKENSEEVIEDDNQQVEETIDEDEEIENTSETIIIDQQIDNEDESLDLQEIEPTETEEVEEIILEEETIEEEELVLEEETFDLNDNYTVEIDDNFFYRIFHLDSGRKYFSVDDIKELIDMLSINNYTHMELVIGNEGLRFLLDDMSIETDETSYTSDQVKEAIHLGNINYYDCGEKNELSQSEMDSIIAYARSRNISIIPLLNSPGHMNALLHAIGYLGVENAAYMNSNTTIDIGNQAAVELTTKIIEKYVSYFSDNGAEIFNIGLDEYALDINKGYGDLINDNLYDDYIDYVNNLARLIKSYGLIPMAFNDGFYFNNHTSSGTFDTDILIAYWHSGWGQYRYRSSANLRNDGFKLINCNSNWYFVLGNPYSFYSYWTALDAAERINCHTLYDRSGVPVNGAMICLWCDDPSKPYVDMTRERLLNLLSTLSNRNPDVFDQDDNIVIDNDDSFMANWLFNYGDVENGESISLNDSNWNNIKVPHDYSSYLDYTNKGEAESGYLLGGVGWYRKHFTIDSNDIDKVIQIHFSGVYMNTTVYINGHELGSHPYGYTPFSFDLSDYINYGGDNVLAVKVDHKLSSSRWYSGSGIIRDVELSIQNKTYIPENGIIIDTSNIDVTKVDTTINSDSKKNIILVQTLYDENYNKLNVEEEAFELNAGTNVISQSFNSGNVKLWSVDDPNLYELRTDIIYNGLVIDSKWNEIGYKTYYTDPNNGFYLNGENIKLKGVCLHSDFGALGTAVNKSALERQLTLMKRMGVNAIKVSHNPGNDQLFKLCNKMGFLVIEEAFDGWNIAKNHNYEDYSKYFNQIIDSNNEILNKRNNMTWAEFDVKQMVLNSVNNPCIIMYSLGNELFVNLVSKTEIDSYVDNASDLIRWIREIDNDHLITIADNIYETNKNGGRGIHNQINDLITSNNGVIGLNYCNSNTYDEYHENNPDWPLFASEVASTLSTREYYESKGIDNEKKQIGSYGEDVPSWGNSAWSAWEDVASRDYVAGEFIWTGIDYTGEPTPWNKTTTSGGYGNNYPKSSYFGVVDTAGFEKDLYYFYQSQWNDEINTLHILPNWNLDKVVRNSEGKIDVMVYSDAYSVELFLNDNSLGRKTFTKYQSPNGFTYQKSDENMYMTWSVDATEGTLRAVAYDENGNVITNTDGRSEVTTSKQAKSIELTAYKSVVEADGKSLFFISAKAVDEDGNYVPNASNKIEFSVVGNATIVATDAGDSTDTLNMKSKNRNLFKGKALAIVRVTSEAGEIKVKAESYDLSSAEIVLTAKEKHNDNKPINKDYPKSITENMFSIDQLIFDYDGKYHKPDVTANYNKTFTKNDYEIIVQEQKNPGKYQITIKGKNNYKGTITKEFEIKPNENINTLDIRYRTHVQSYGWQSYVSNGDMSGTSGKAKRLEGINIYLSDTKGYDVGIKYTTHCQSYGWLPWVKDGDMSGTSGESKRLESIKIELTGSNADKFDVYYRVHAQTYGWLSWAKNGEEAGTAGLSKRLEGIQIIVLSKDSPAPSKTYKGITSKRNEAFIGGASSKRSVITPGQTYPVYRSYVQSKGWMENKYNGMMSGTTGKSKRLEAITITLEDKDNNPLIGGNKNNYFVRYRAHVQSVGWQDWVYDGQVAGLEGQGKRVEAIKIELAPSLANQYDIYYRLQVQTYGWLAWAKNGEMSGTSGLSKRVESIQIIMVKKGANPPSNSHGGYNMRTNKIYIK